MISDEKYTRFQMSNETNHIFFTDKVEIIISKTENKVIYIDKDKNITILSFDEVSVNPCMELLKRIKYIQSLNLTSIMTKINHKIEKINYHKKQEEDLEDKKEVK